MAQIIKHRRGSIDSLKGSLARKGELVIATGSIGNMNGPWVFVGDNDANGAYKPTSQIYRGNIAPTISNLTYGSTLDGTPFYSITSKSLFILDSTGNAELDLTGNIEGNTISGVTINDLQSTNVTASFVSGAFIGDASGLYNLSLTGITGLELNKITSGSATASISPDHGLEVNVNVSTTSDLFVTGTVHIGDNTVAQIYKDGALYIEDHDSGVQIYSNNYAELHSGDSYIWVEDDQANVEGNTYTRIYTNSGNVDISSYDGGTLNLNTDSGEGDIHIGLSNLANSTYINSYNTFITGANLLYMGMNGDTAHIQFTNNFAELYSDVDVSVVAESGSLSLHSNTGSVYITAHNNNMVLLNTATGAGEIQIGNNTNDIRGYTNLTSIVGGLYTQLSTSQSFVITDESGSYIVNNGQGLGLGVGFTARNNKIEATGSLFIGGDVNISGNTSVTGAFVVSNGSATFDQGLVAQNSNMLLTSGSSLIIQDNGHLQVAGDVYITGSEYVDTIFGKTDTNNYLAFNGGAVGAPNVELNSSGYISLWAEGGNVNVTGSMKVTGNVTVEQDLYVSGNIYQTGSFYTQGNITLSGSINLGDFTGDTVNFNGEVNSNILPTTGATYNLGSSGQTWNEVHAEYYYGDGSHLTNISLTGITGLQLDKIVSGAATASISEANGLQVNTSLGVTGSLNVSGSANIVGPVDIKGDATLTGSLFATKIEGTGSLYLQPDQADSRLFEIYNTGAGSDIHIKGNSLYSFFGDDTNYLKLDHDINDVTVRASNTLYLTSQNSSIYQESYDGTIYLNDDSGNNVRMGGNAYINDNLYVNRIYDNNNNNNYLQLDGWNTDDGYWWESGNGDDTTLLNNTNNNNLNILQTNNGDVNIDATGGSVNLHSANGFNVTGSLVVSDASGVFNSSLVANNSNLTLDNGSNIEMNAGHIYFNDGCGDIYYNTSTNNLSLYNDCGDIRLENNTYTSNHIYIENNNTLYTNNVYGWDGGNLDLGGDGNVYIHSDNNRYVEIYSNNSESGTNRLKVQESGISLETYDFASGLTHKVELDNTGSLNLTNVAVKLSGSLNVNGNSKFNNDLTVDGNMYVSGNFTVLGTGSIISLTGSQVDFGTNQINLNTYAPFERFAGINVFDSGSNVGVTGSLLWDSLNDVWIYANPSGSNYASARFIAGPKNTGSLGEEIGLTVGHFPIATGDDHISDSLLTYELTTLALNTNKFTVDSESGDTLIHGNFTIEGVGGTDNGTYSSYIVFKNSDNVLGFVDTTVTENITDGLLGYNATTGELQFSSLIDGGTY